VIGWKPSQQLGMYSHTLMIQYENSRWIEHFKASGDFVSCLTMKLKHLMQKDLRYKCVVHVRICVVYFLYKLVHWCIFVLLQWNVQYWQGKNSFGFARIHLCYECGFQKSILMVKTKRLGGSVKWVQRIFWSTFYSWCHRCNSNPYLKASRSFHQGLFLLWSYNL